MHVKKLLYILHFGVILLTLSCTKKEEYPIRLITFRNDIIIPYSKFFEGVVFPIDSLHYGSFPAQKGDFVMTNNFFLPITADLPDTLDFHDQDSILIINKHVAIILIDNAHPTPDFFAQLTKEDIQHLIAIVVSDSLTEDYKTQLKRIGQQKPEINFMIDGYNTAVANRDLSWLLLNFNPAFLFSGFEIDSLNLLNLASENLETLAMPYNKSSPIPALNSLKYLIIAGDSATMNPGIFDENHQLKRLTILNETLKTTGLPAWHALKNLEELNIVMVDSIVPYSLATYHPKLKTLNVKSVGNISTIAELNKLKWLSIGKNLTNKEFDQLINALPNLELFSFSNTDSLRDFSHLKKLSKLKYLMISGKSELDTSLYNLTGLNYLSIPESFLKDTVKLNALQHALPTTVITVNGGLCMGTGWLLLVLPLSVLLLYLHHHIGKTRTQIE